MTTTPLIIKNGHFSGGKKIFARDNLSLTYIIRGLLREVTKTRLKGNLVTLTDNSTGVATTSPYQFVAIPLPTTAFNATSAGGAALSNLNSALTTLENAHNIISAVLNIPANIMGLPPIVYTAVGATPSSTTIPALTKTGTTASGTSAADFTTALAALTVVLKNQEKIQRLHGMIVAGIGDPMTLAAPLTTPPDATYTLLLPPAIVASSTGASSLALTDATNFLTACANNIASLAASYALAATDVANGVMPLTAISG